jgi:GntR family transcriptional repressor for pyruvate dehydrogenase complex
MYTQPGRNLSQVVTEDLLRQIGEGRFKVGDRLPTQQELMRTYGVGHSVVREAMQQLVAVGIVDVRPRRGAIVLSVDASSALDAQILAALLTDQAVEDLYALRRVIEVAIAGQAAEHATPAQIAAIEEVHERFGQASSRDLPVFHIDVEWHRAVAEASQNLVYVRVLDALADVLAAIREQARRVPGATVEAHVQHTELLDAIKARDPDAARAAMERHIDTATEVIRVARRLPPRGSTTSEEGTTG